MFATGMLEESGDDRGNVLMSANPSGARQGILSLAVKDKAALYHAYMRTPARDPQVQVAIAGSGPAQADPFAPSTVIQTRPWPRALLPNAPASGAFTVEYGSPTPSFYPFAPRTAIATGAPVDGDRANADNGDETP